MGNSGSVAKENEEEIIIKCSLEDMTKSFFKDCIIIWHDPNFYSQENQRYISQLEKLCKVAAFLEWKEASQGIQSIKEVQVTCHVITSGTNGEELVKEISPNENVSNIYVFCQNKEYHSNWAKNYQKVSCVETQLQNILDRFQQNLLESYKQISSLKLNLPAFAPIFDDMDKSGMNHLHRFLKIIPNFKNRRQAKNDFISLSKNIYSDAKNTKFIADFEKDYNEYDRVQTLKWYTQESFLYKVTNNCLRIAKPDSIQYCRLLLKDIEQAIKEEYQTKSKHFYGLLYRGAYLSQDEWSSLKENTDREIEMHGFLSVSQEKSVALKFLKKDSSQKVLITIIVPKGPNEQEQGFAEIAEYSRFPKEKEVLFNVRSRFTVLETENEYSPDLPYRHLVLLYGAQGFRRFVTEKNPVEDVEILDFENLSCARCQVKPEKMLFMSLQGHFYCCQECVDKINIHEPAPLLCISLMDDAEKMHPQKIKGCLLMNSSANIEIPFYGYKCSKCPAKKQKKYFTCADCGNRWCENCFDMAIPCFEAHHNIILERRPFSFWTERMSESELNHLEYQKNLITKDKLEQAQIYFQSHKYEEAIKYFQIYIQQNEAKGNASNVAASYNEMGLAFNHQGEHDKALECYMKSLDIRKLLKGENHSVFGILYHNIGTTYDKLGKYSEALEFHFKFMEISKSLYGENHLLITKCYNNLGLTLSNQGNFREALEYFQKGLDITKSLYGENHPRFIICYNNVGLGFSNLGDYDKALEFFMRSLDLNKSLHGELHHDVAIAYSNIGRVYERQGKFNKALECCAKSLEISKFVHKELHPEVASYYNNMGLAYVNLKEYSKALECYQKSLKIRQSVSGENHPDVAISLNNIGQIYDKQGDYKKALEFYMKSLDIGKPAHGELHPLVATTYSSLGMNSRLQGDYNKSLGYYFKALVTFQAVYGENHPDIANAYNNIGFVYDSLGESSKAVEYYKKSLDIDKSIHGKLHHDVAISYSNIGLAYCKQGKYEEALGCLFESLNIRKSISGENHQEVANCYNNIGSVFNNKGEYKTAIEYYLKSLDIKKLLLGELHPDIAIFYGDIGAKFLIQAEYDQALECFFQTLKVFKSVYGEYHPEIANSYNVIGAVYEKQGKLNDALEYHLKTLEVLKALYGEYHPQVANSYSNIGMAYFNLYENDKALEYCLKSLDIRTSIYENNHPETIILQNFIFEKFNQDF